MKNNGSRRRFIRNTAMASLAVAASSFRFKTYQPKLAFSTLGCPDWSFDTILQFASAHGFDGIEIRGIQRQLDLSQCAEFDSKEHIQNTISKLKEHHLRVVDLGSSANMHLPDGSDREKSMDEAKRFIELAQELDCPYIRVFPNNLPKDVDKNITIDRISKGLQLLGDFAKGTNVKVLMETHGDLLRKDDIVAVMDKVQHPNVGLVWDIVNMWSVTKEPVRDVYNSIKKYVHHTHIKDLKFVNGKETYVLLGAGETPVLAAIDLLATDGYKGYFSFEWEKMWHPEIDAPEVAIAAYAKTMKEHFSSM